MGMCVFVCVYLVCFVTYSFCYLTYMLEQNSIMSKEQFPKIFNFNSKLGQSVAEEARQINLVWEPITIG